MYKIAIRNIINNDIEVYDFKLDKSPGYSTLMTIDEFFSKYESKEKFLNDAISYDDYFNYDVYIVYNSLGGYKFLDAYFGKNLANEQYREKMINNIVNKGLKKEGFIDYLSKNAKSFYQNFDHYRQKNFEYNNLKRYINCIKKSDYADAEFYKHAIKVKLENDYNKFRKMTDYAYRYTDKNRTIYDEQRKKVNYNDIFSKSIAMNLGQLSVFDYLKIENCSETIFNHEKQMPTLFSDSLINQMNEKNEINNIINLYIDLLDNDEIFVDIVYDSTLPKYLKDLSYKYSKSTDLNYEDIMEADYQKNIIKSKLSNKKNIKIVSNLIKDYLTKSKVKKI